MTTNPIAGPVFDQPRDPSGRFGPVPLSAVELELVRVEPAAGWPGPDTDPADAQAMLHDIAWDSDRPEPERARAARGAIAYARDDDGRLSSIPPTDEAEGFLTDAVTDDDVVLDAVHELNPLPYPSSQGFGAELAGRIFDTWTRMHDEHHAEEATRLADLVLPPESDASRRAADEGHRRPQASFERCGSCHGNGDHIWQHPVTGEIDHEQCRGCDGTGHAELTPVNRP